MSNTGKIKILVVEDDPQMSELVKEMLHLEENFDVTLEHDPTKVLGWANKKPLNFDLMIFDIMLPGMTGIELLKSLKSNPNASSIPVIMLTVSHSNQDEVECLKEEADDFVRKPFNPSVLIARIQSILRRKN